MSSPGAFGQAPLNRRDALRLLALGLTASVAGCKPAEDIVPAVANPGGLPVGEPLRFATTLPLGGYGRGVLATSIDGRPTKISGNPLHPASLGASDIFTESDILGLYDPDRSRTPLKNGQIAPFDALLAELRPRLTAYRATGGEGLSLLTGRLTSPTLLRQIGALQARFPRMRRHRYEPIGDDNARAGARIAFGRRLDLVPHLGNADIVLCLGADPLGPGPAQMRNADGFARRRTVRGGRQEMQRLYVVESALSLTGAAADHRLARVPVAIRALARAIAIRLGASYEAVATPDDRFIAALADDLIRAGPRALVLVDEEQPPELHALGHWLNGTLGGIGTSFDLVPPVDPVEEDHAASIAGLAGDLHAGRIETLVVLGGNPAYDAPADLGFADGLRQAALSIHLGCYADETAKLCHWHVPESHPLESWGDLRSVDGTASIIQPLIRPLYASRSASQILGVLDGEEDGDPRDLVQRTWRSDRTDFEDWWLRVVEDGTIADSASPPSPAPSPPPLPDLPDSAGAFAGLALLLRPDPTIWDGRYANNAWLQECPKPLTHEVWGNALRLHPDDAVALSLSETDAVRIEANGRGVEAPLLFDRFQARGTAALSLGYGRTAAGAIGSDLGVDGFAMRSQGAAWIVPGATVTRIGEADPIPRTQWTLDDGDRDLAPEMRLADLAAGRRLREPGPPPPTLYPEQVYETPDAGGHHAWAMVIDTALCIGCNACVVACQSENNVPVVGPDEIRNGRDMHWLRIDTYERDEDDDARAAFQPVPCMHCEKAPCEPVCPVGASVHDHEGLNNQVYNRCVGTRFCQANCPYKVRRFNFFGYGAGQEYANLGAEPLPARLNPDVTVRGRGVMEKCTYCVQRISGARRAAERDGRPLADGDVVTACAAACPTRAIRFGDLADAGGAIAGLRAEPQHYGLLEELGTKPRTTYLARLRNAHPDLEGDGA